MHAIQQIRHNAFKCWVNLHEIETGCEPACTMWSEDGVAGGKIAWAFQIGLVKGLLAHIRQYKRARSDRDKRKFGDEVITNTHTIINRGDMYRNMRCAVCLHLESQAPRAKEKMKVRRSKYWCPHPSCRAHACTDHRIEIHNYAAEGVILENYHNCVRVDNTIIKSPPEKKRKASSSKKYFFCTKTT